MTSTQAELLSNLTHKWSTCRIAKSMGRFYPLRLQLTIFPSTYIIATAIANQTKDRFYNVDLPLIEDVRRVPCTSSRLLIIFFSRTCVSEHMDMRIHNWSIFLERQQENLITGLVGILRQGHELHTKHLTTLQNRVNSVQETLGQVNAASDQDLFIAYNTRMFTVPNDWGWEPCAGYYDTGEMATESEPKIFLQNKLARCREKLEETQRQIDIKSRYLNSNWRGWIEFIALFRSRYREDVQYSDYIHEKSEYWFSRWRYECLHFMSYSRTGL